MGFCEIDKKAEAAYRAMYDTEKEVFFNDASKINTDEMPGFDLFVGGFPCQPFSVAGKRRGFEDTRGTLFHHIARIIKAKKPAAFLLENVPSWNVFREQFERVLPASSAANLYPFSFSGKTDENGFYLGRDKFGSNVIVDFNKRADDKTKPY